MKIRINTIDNVKDFVSICSKYQDSDINVKQGRYIVNGKSILGIFSLNLVETHHFTSFFIKKVSYRTF